jgi:transposase-like protein
MSDPRSEATELADLVSRFDSEEKCRAFLEQLRWPDGVRCPRCAAERGISRIEARSQFECDSCGYQFSVRARTAFHASHLPLWKWLLAVYVMCESPNGVSANQLRKLLGVSYKTAWYLCHRIRAAMKDDAPRGVSRSVLARTAVGPHQHLSAKHLQAYVDEAAFRLRNRGNEHRLRDTLLRLLATRSIPYAELVAND